MWSPNELLKIEKQRDILSYITLQFFHFKKVPLEHCPKLQGSFLAEKIPPPDSFPFLSPLATSVPHFVTRSDISPRSGENLSPTGGSLSLKGDRVASDQWIVTDH